MKLMFKYIMKNKLLMTFNIIGLFCFALVELGIPTVVSKIIDDGIAKQDIAYVWWMGLIILVLALIGSAGTVLLIYASSKISTNAARDIRNDIFSKSQTFSHAEYDKFGISSMIIRTTNDVFQLQQFINLVLRTALLTPLMIVASISMTLYTSTSLSMVVGIAIPIMLVAIVIMAAFVKPISERQQMYLDRLNQVSRENLTGVRVIRAFRKEEYEINRFYESNKNFTKETKKIFKLMSLSQPSFVFLLNFAVLGVFIVSSNLINTGSLEVGQMVAFMDYQFHTMFSFMLFALVFSLYPRARVSAGRISELLRMIDYYFLYTSDPVVNQKCNVFEYVYLDSLLALFRISGRMTEEEIQRLETQIRLNQEKPVEDLSHTLISGSGYCRVLEEMGIPMYGEEGEENN